MHDEEREVQPEPREIAVPADRAHHHHRRRRAHARQRQTAERSDDHDVFALRLRDRHVTYVKSSRTSLSAFLSTSASLRAFFDAFQPETSSVPFTKKSFSIFCGSAQSREPIG